MEPSLYVESWSESRHNVTDDLPEDFQVSEDEGMFRIAERYLHGRVTLHLHLRIRPRGLDGDSREFCAVVASDHGDVLHLTEVSYLFGEDDVPRELTRVSAFAPAPNVVAGDRHCLRNGATDVQDAMLVHIVEPRKEGKVRIRRAFSRTIGLQELDGCPIIRAYSAKRSTPNAILIPLPSFLDGELRLASGTTASESDELPDEIVKRGPQVVSELPDDQPDTGVGEFPAEAKDVLAGVALEMTDDGVVFLVKEGVPFVVERGQVLVRSFKSPIDGF
jgi:hypothetical protein